MITVSPAFTVCPCDASTAITLPGTEDLISTLPAFPAGCGVTACGVFTGCGAGAALCCTGAAPFPAVYSTVSSYSFPFTVIL